MQNKLISIVIPMYNAQNYIVKLLECLRNQTYKNLEIVIINDGSTDNSLQLVNECIKKDNRIKVISIPNGGVSNARNLGIENTTGEYITFLDADDYIEYDMYEKIMQKINDENVDIIRSNFVKEDTNGNLMSTGEILDLSNKVLDNSLIKEKLLPYIFDNLIPTYTPLIFAKSELIKNKLKFRTDIHMMEDLIFCLELFFSVSKIYFYDFKCYHYVYNMSSSSKTRKNLMRNFNDTIKVVSILEEFLNKQEIDNILFSKIYHIYSTMIVKYILRTFQKNDEYTISKGKMIELLEDPRVRSIISRAEFIEDNEYIKTAGNYIKEKAYDKLYDYAIKVSNINI